MTLGKSETTILAEIREVIPQIISYERQARTTLTRESREALHDRMIAADARRINAILLTRDTQIASSGVVPTVW